MGLGSLEGSWCEAPSSRGHNGATHSPPGDTFQKSGGPPVLETEELVLETGKLVLETKK